MLYLIILKLLFNDDKVRSIEALIIDGTHNGVCAKNVYSLGDGTDNYCRYVMLRFFFLLLFCFYLCALLAVG
jgi:hypothetical protein